MKQILLLSMVFLFAIACKNEDKSVKVLETDSTTISFTETLFDFGEIMQGEQIKHTFIFKNSGDKPLLIKEVHSSCGCTVANYTDKPVNPQSEGFIKVTFNSAGKQGSQYKTITIISNTKPEKNVLVISGNVKFTSDN